MKNEKKPHPNRTTKSASIGAVHTLWWSKR